MTSETPYGFSDDNANGMVVSGTAATTENGTAMAMYESYDKSPSVSVADLDSLLADPRLTWVTNPALNDAGEGVDIKMLAADNAQPGAAASRARVPLRTFGFVGPGPTTVIDPAEDGPRDLELPPMAAR